MDKANKGRPAMVHRASQSPGACFTFRRASCREAKLSETPGRKARAGQLVRLLDVPAERGEGFGVFDNGGPDGDASALAKTIKLAATKAYGTAGPAFVRRLIADGVTGEDVRRLIY